MLTVRIDHLDHCRWNVAQRVPVDVRALDGAAVPGAVHHFVLGLLGLVQGQGQVRVSIRFKLLLCGTGSMAVDGRVGPALRMSPAAFFRPIQALGVSFFAHPGDWGPILAAQRGAMQVLRRGQTTPASQECPRHRG